MAYERLAKLISNLEGAPVQISDAFLFKFGALLIAQETPPETDEHQYSATKALRNSSQTFPIEITKTIRKALEEHPNIFHVKNAGDKTVESIYGACTGMLVIGPAFTMEVHFPQAQRQFEDCDTPEQFNVISNGSYFGAYSPIDDVPVFSAIANEFRELARKQVEANTPYKVPLFGPTPVHPDVIITRINGNGEKTAMRAYEYEGNLYIVCDADSRTESLMEFIFYRAGKYWHGYYELLLDRSGSIDLDIEIQNRFSDLSSDIAKLLSTPAWKFWAVSSTSKRTALSIAKIHELMIEYHSARWFFDNARRDFLNRIKDQHLFSKLNRITKEDCRRDFCPPKSVTEALAFLEKQIEVGRNIRSLVVASVLGAVIGAVLTGCVGLVAKQLTAIKPVGAFHASNPISKTKTSRSSPQ